MGYMEKLQSEKLTLIVSLPRNDHKLAQSAIKAGADVIKIHINVEHRASSTVFKSFHEEYKEISKILTICKERNIPIGIVPGGNDNIQDSEIKKIVEAGFDFISVYDKHMNPSVLKESISKMIAIDNKFKIEYVDVINELPIDIIECSIMEPETYGQNLTMREIMEYKIIRNHTEKPIVIPTQRNITPEQALVLQEIGVNGLMIGAIVTGKTEESIYEATKIFREKIDSYGGR